MKEGERQEEKEVENESIGAGLVIVIGLAGVVFASGIIAILFFAPTVLDFVFRPWTQAGELRSEIKRCAREVPIDLGWLNSEGRVVGTTTTQSMKNCLQNL
jgi:hypothetical protein